MKYFIHLASILFLLVFMNGCNKSKSSLTLPKSNWTWSLSNSHFIGNSTTYADLTLQSVDDPYSPQIWLMINFSTKPDSNSYAVLDYPPFNNATPSCDVEFYSNGQLQCESTGGGTVNVTITNGKITATFSNIPMGVITGSNSNGMRFFNPDGTVSGEIIEQ